MVDKEIPQILIPMGPSTRVDSHRVKKAYKKSNKETRFLLSGGEGYREKTRLNLMTYPLIEQGIDEERIILNNDKGSYAHIFNDFIDRINEFPLTGISTNPIGFKRFQLYMNAAKREGLIKRNKKIIGLNSLEYITNPLGFLVETLALKKDMNYFWGKFTPGLEEKYEKPRKKLFGKDGRVIGK